jgi:large subunit ribosomal protein L31
MKQGIHPDFVETRVTCSCGNTFTTRSIKPELHVELCNQCHPFYTGKQKLVDTGGRVERFQKKYAKRQQAAPAATEPDTQGSTTDETSASPEAASDQTSQA